MSKQDKTPVVWHDGLTWYGLQKEIAMMPADRQNDSVTIRIDGEFIGVKGELGTCPEDDILDKGHQYLVVGGGDK